MENLNRRKAFERSFTALLLSLGLGAILYGLFTDTAGRIISIMLSIVVLLSFVFGFHKLLGSFFYKAERKAFNSFLSIFVPLALVILFSSYSIFVLLMISSSGTMTKSITIIITFSGLLAIANLAVLVANIDSLLQGP